MLERAGSAAFDYDMHGGTALTRVQWYFLDRARLPVAVQLWELPPGGAEGMHAHREDEPLEELYLVVEGTATMRVDEQTHVLGPGDAVLAPVGSDHDLHNTGGTVLKVVVVWGRPAEADWSNFGTARASRQARARSDRDEA
ncbi:cupin domain-containing protein [Saccharopolyspora sp. WRP15-2]|uniref:Cupin domain-containing protein n=1 Tax=Saccharopolyspora oryzae TaxID=2997343 RepID=A0ABT4UUT1_9PSEU|nr:cupin domain-containing protein [Saccharopolyspora oryzae]MDA3625470.1 cupin domain-containing protein [Saccharopolyspora oryzae]